MVVVGASVEGATAVVGNAVLDVTEEGSADVAGDND
jgi:hypothetical protein